MSETASSMKEGDRRSHQPGMNALLGSAPSSAAATGEGRTDRNTDVVISGAGPVGLFLANLLGRRGLRILVVERRRRVPQGSLAIGITPPSLSLLKSLALDHLFSAHGVRIDTARVFENRVGLGDVDFSQLPAEHRFILSLPQSTTVRLLRDNLSKFPNVGLVEGVEVIGHGQTERGVCVQLKDRDSRAISEVKSAFLVGCEGHRSTTRKHAGIKWREHDYRPCFLMADFDDNTTCGREAHLYFGPRGSVESFPLPEGQRRWIVQTDQIPGKRDGIGNLVAARVRERAGFDLPAKQVHFQSSYQPRRALALEYVKGRVILCGDAAHVMSAIGGQGMNTGLADAAHLDRVLAASLESQTVDWEGFADYHQARSRAFRVAANRAACGMWLGTGRGFFFSIMRRMLISRILLGSSVRERLAPFFAMLTIPGSPAVSNEPLSVERGNR